MSDSEARHAASASGGLDGSAGASANRAEVVSEGEIVAGKFRVERILGSGGMGIVVEARDVDLDARVAIKFLLPAALERPDIVARFRREARATVKIKSKHIARVLDVGSREDGSPFIVMEYLEGEDLSKIIQKKGRLEIKTAVDYVLQAADALAEAHVLGIVHRDIKPPNLFLARGEDGSSHIKVVDFGISKVIGGLDTPDDADIPEATLTQSTVVLGSPRYMAPEQISKPKSVDARADIWGIGSTFYRLVTGVAPYEGNTLPEIFAAILMTPEGPPPIQQYVPDAPPELDAVIRRCMRIKPADRWANIGDLAAALAPFGSAEAKRSAALIQRTLENAGIKTNMPALVTGVSSDAAQSSPASTSGAYLANPAATTLDGKRGHSKSNSLMYVIAGIALLGLAALGFVFFQSKPIAPTNTAVPGLSTDTITPPTAMTTVAPLVTTPPTVPVPIASAANPAPDASATVSASTTTTAKVHPPKPQPQPRSSATKTGDGDGEELFDQRN